MENSYRVASIEYDEKEYLRRALIDLGADVRTPKDIFESKFGTPTLENRQIIAVRGTAHLNYSAEVGTTRKVNTVTDRGATVTKSVTDWRPVSGQYSSESYGFSENCINPDTSETPFIANAVRTCKHYDEYDEDEETAEPLEPCAPALRNAKADMVESSKSKCRDNIGTQVRKFKCDGHVEPDLVASYVLPRYNVEYEYKGEKYTHRAYAVGKFRGSGSLPDEAKRIEARADKLTLPLFIASIVASIASAILSIRGIPSTDYETVVSALTPVQILFVLATLLFIGNKFSVKILRYITYTANLNTKKRDLIAKLSHLGLCAPTDEELKCFKFGTHSNDIKSPIKRILPTVAYVICCIPFAFKLLSYLSAMKFSLVFVFVLLIGVIVYNIGLAVYRIKKAKNSK